MRFAIGDGIDGSFSTDHSPDIQLQATQCRSPAPQQPSSSVPRGTGRLSQAVIQKSHYRTEKVQ